MSTEKLTIMNKNYPILDFLYDCDLHSVVKILECFDVARAPFAFFDNQGNITKRTVNQWWVDRPIPASRPYVSRLIDDLGADSILALIEANNALSLSDRYWVNNPQSPKRWEDINFFDNDFSEDLGFFTLNLTIAAPKSLCLMSPDASTAGNLTKRGSSGGCVGDFPANSQLAA